MTTTINNLFKRFLLLKVIVAIGVIMCFIAFGCNKSKMEQKANQKTEKCNLTVEQVRTLRGFKLGQSIGEIRKRFPKLPNLRPDKYGEVYMSIYVDNYVAEGYPSEFDKDAITVKSSRYPELKGVHVIHLSFVDDKVAKIQIGYPYESSWRPSSSSDDHIRNLEERKNILEFAKLVSESLNITGEWEHQYVDALGEPLDSMKVSCKGFYVLVGYYHARLYVLMEEPSATNLVSTRFKDDEGKKRKSFRP